MAEGRSDAGGPVAKLQTEGLAIGKGAVEWIGSRWNEAVNFAGFTWSGIVGKETLPANRSVQSNTRRVAQQSVSKWTKTFQPMSTSNVGNRVAPKPDENADQVKCTAGQILDKEMQAWRRNSSWVDETPILEVSVPKGAFCQVNSRFKIGLPPEAVWNILIDPGNKRVFKNIQEVTYRKVLEDDGDRQLVEVDQAAIWRFLWFSGTLSVCVLVDQDRRTHLMKYRLARQGFMKQFEGSWEVQPLYIDSQGSPTPESVADRVASIVLLQQVVQPAMVPPPPFKGYVRGITTRTTEALLYDLQAEGKRLRESSSEDSVEQSEISRTVQNEDENLDHLRKTPGSRRKTRKSRWRVKEDSNS